jgi:hypothetical protein
MPEEPSDAVLLELGRLTWAAINLEDVIPSMRRAMGRPPARLDRAPISEWVSNALGVLAGWPESEARQRGTRWFTTAQQALEERNHVLHSVPVIEYTRADDGTLTAGRQALDYIPRRAGVPFSRIALSEGELRAVRQRLAGAREGWIEVYTALDEAHNRIGGA